jgi:hypothetical protein
MALSNVTELKAAIAAWAHTDDLTAQLDDFITLAEARFNRRLRVRAMEQTLASTALVDGAVALPAGFLAFKELRYDNSNGHTLEPRPLEWVRNINESGSSADTPRYFAVTNTHVVCAGQAGSVEGTYYQAIDSLTGAATNWLLTSCPDLYLFACLEESAIFTRDYEAGALWGKRAVALMEQIQSADDANALSGGPLTIRRR